VPFTLVHAGKYRTEDKVKMQTIQKLNTSQKKQTTQNTAKQNYQFRFSHLLQHSCIKSKHQNLMLSSGFPSIIRIRIKATICTRKCAVFYLEIKQSKVYVNMHQSIPLNLSCYIILLYPKYFYDGHFSCCNSYDLSGL